MSSVFAIVSKAVFEKQAKVAGRLLVPGDVWPTTRYESAHASLEALASGGALYLVTVRPGDVLWRVAILESPRKTAGGWESAPNAAPIADITALIPRLEFANGKGIKAQPGKLGMSLQTPRPPSPADEALLRDREPPASSEATLAADVLRLRARVAARPEPEPSERSLSWLRSRFERHVANKPPDSIDLALIAALVAEAERLEATGVYDEWSRLLGEVRRAQHPDTASANLGWGRLANEQYAVYRRELGRLKTPFAALDPALYERVISRLTQIRAAMAGDPNPRDLERNLAIIDEKLARYAAELRELCEVRAALGGSALASALGQALDDLELLWPRVAGVHAALVDPTDLSILIDRVDEVRRQLEARGASPALERARDLEDAWIAAYGLVQTAQIVVPDTSLPDARTRPVRLEPHAVVERTRAIATLAKPGADAKNGKDAEDAEDGEDAEDAEDDEPAPIRMKRGGELVLLPGAVLVFATLGPRSESSHFPERQVFRWLAWRDKTWDYHQDLRAEMGRADGGRPVHLFVRIGGDPNYFYAGEAAIVASRDRAAHPGVWVELALSRPIPLAAWRRFGGPFRAATVAGKEHEFGDAPDRFERWIAASAGVGHIELVSEDGAKLTLHGAGPRVELEYRESLESERLYGSDESVAADAPPVDIVCRCGHTRELRALETVTRADAIAALTTFMSSAARPHVLKRRPEPPATSNAWLRRYRAGEHIAVWNEIRALGAAVASGATRDDAREVLREMMLRVRSNIDRITERLRAFAYKFEEPDKTRVPLTEAERANLARNDDPAFLPLSLRMFLEVVGQVNLVQHEDQHSFDDVHATAGSLGALGQDGPLEIEAMATHAHEVSREPRRAAIFREDCLKAGSSGDYHYFDLPNPAADFYIRSGDIELEYFVDYLRATLANGGFRGHLGCEEEHADDKGYGAVPAAFRYFLARDLEPF